MARELIASHHLIGLLTPQGFERSRYVESLFLDEKKEPLLSKGRVSGFSLNYVQVTKS